MKKSIKRLLAFILALAMCVSTTGVAAYAEESVVTDKVNTESGWDGVTTVNNYTGENFNVVFSLANYWEGGYNANVKVENTGSSVIENWYLSFALDNSISSIWNAEVVSSENSQYVVKNANWNADIPIGGCVEFGISVNETFAGFPKEYKLLGENTQVQDEAYSVEYILDSDWGTGFTARMLLTNHTETELEDWTLEFDFDREITSIWNGVIEKHEGNHYVIKNAGHNANVVSESAISFGFNGKGGTPEDKPTNCKLIKIEAYEALEEIEWVDSDGDLLCDSEEVELGTDPMKADTDGDGASDFLERMNGTDPLVPDIDKLRDGDIDADSDGLLDYEELVVHKTNPVLYDTDADGLDDGFEIKNGLNPLLPDTDGDGVPDNEERILQEISEEIENAAKKEILSVSVFMEAAGNINSTTKIKDTYGIDLLSSEVVGLVGVPVDISSSTDFEKATIVFAYNEEALGDVKEENLRVMWYDEENNQYVIFDEETVLDTENNVLSYTTTHFSTYLVVDRQEWYDVWSNAVAYGRQPSGSNRPQFVDICYLIDKSGSMSGSYMRTAKESIQHFIDAMYSDDQGAVVAYASSAVVYQDFTTDKDALKKALDSVNASGGTNVESGLVKALELFPIYGQPAYGELPNKKVLVLLCDGDVNYTDATLNRAKSAGVKVFTVLIGSTYGQAKLERLSEETGGVFYYAANASEIRDAIFGVQGDTIGEIDTTDTDGDGLYDVYELGGMILPNGKYLYTDPEDDDCDDDGLLDGEEMGAIEKYEDQSIVKRIILTLKGFPSTVYAEYFDYRSDPYEKDGDGDGYSDYVELKETNSSAWKCDVETWELKNDYISVRYAGAESWNNNFDTTDLTKSFGGDQGWIFDSNEENVFSPLTKDYVIEKHGCGLISMVDILLYLSKSNSKYETIETELVKKNSLGEYDFASYTLYVRFMELSYLQVNRFGLPGISVANGFKTYEAYRRLGLDVSWGVSKDEILSTIEEMLEEDIPVTLLITSFTDEKVALYVRKTEEVEGKPYVIEDNGSRVGKHFVTVTGIIKDDILEKTYLEVASWGSKYYIDYEEYIDFVEEHSNSVICNIVKISKE